MWAKFTPVGKVTPIYGMCVEKVWKSLLCANRVWGCPLRDQNIYRPKMGKKLTNLNQYITAITDTDEKWFMIFEHTINHLSFAYVRLPQPKYYFSFASFFLFFLLCRYLLLNR